MKFGLSKISSSEQNYVFLHVYHVSVAGFESWIFLRLFMPLTIPLHILTADFPGGVRRPDIETVRLHRYYRVGNVWRCTGTL